MIEKAIILMKQKSKLKATMLFLLLWLFFLLLLVGLTMDNKQMTVFIAAVVDVAIALVVV